MPHAFLPGSRAILLLLALFLCTSPAHAIPPPDMVASVWQSVLQFAGVAIVFLGGAVFALRQWLSHYLGRWLKPVLLGLLASVLAVSGWLLLGGNTQAAERAVAPIQGERVTIETVIRRETDTWVRDWEFKFLGEMQKDAGLTRQRKGLSPRSYLVVDSFTPAQLAKLLQTRSSELYLLDIREPYERGQFRLKHPASNYRYGDLVQDIPPTALPKDKMIVLLCHSGLRGYMAANFLRHMGFSRVAFLQGGLGRWSKEGLPVNGNAEFPMGHYPEISKTDVEAFRGFKVQLDSDGTPKVRLSGLVQLPYETASSGDLRPLFQAAANYPVLLVCNTYGGCFHSLNLAWEIRQKGGKLLGIHDASGKQMALFK